MLVGSRIKRAIGLTALLATVEYFLLPVVFLLIERSISLFNDSAHEPGFWGGVMLFPVLAAFFKTMFLSYLLTMIVLCILDRPDSPRIDLWKLVVANFTGYVLLRLFFIYHAESGLRAWGMDELVRSSHAASYQYAIAVVAVVAPLFVGKIANSLLPQILARIKRAVAIVVLLFPIEFLLMLLFFLALESAFVMFGGEVDKSLFSRDGWFEEGLKLVLTTNMLRVILHNYQLVGALLMVFGGASKNPRAGFIKLLAVNVGGGALSLVLFASWGHELLKRLFFFQDHLSWGVGLLLYWTIAAGFVAPWVLYCVSWRARWLTKILGNL